MIKKIIWIVILLGLAIYFIPLFYSTILPLFASREDQSTDNAEEQILTQPILDITRTATNSAQFAVSGYAQNADSVTLYINDIKKEQLSIKKKDGSFRSVLTLYEGNNTIEARAEDVEGNTSDRSDAVDVFFSKNEPELTIEYPQDNSEVKSDKNTIFLKATIAPENKITVNNRLAIVSSSGSVNHPVILKEGGNEIIVIVSDPAGNMVRKSIRVSYSKQ